MTRERARSERRDVDRERGEPLAEGDRRAGRRRAARAQPLPDWSPRPRILVTNDDGVESRGLLALKQALDPVGDVTVVAPDTNQSAVGHQKTLMRPLRVRERVLADGSLAYRVDGSPTDAVSLAFLGFFDHGFDLVAAGINYGANLGDDITYSGTVSAAMEGVINDCPAFAISQEYYEHPDFDLAARGRDDRRPQHPRARAGRRRAASTSTSRRSPSRSSAASRSRAWASASTRTSSWSGSIRAASRTTGSAGRRRRGCPSPGTDFHAVVSRRIAVTPIHLDLTGRRLLRRLKTWSWELDAAVAEDGPAHPRPQGGGRRRRHPGDGERHDGGGPNVTRSTAESRVTIRSSPALPTLVVADHPPIEARWHRTSEQRAASVTPDRRQRRAPVLLGVLAALLVGAPVSAADHVRPKVVLDGCLPRAA